MSKPVQYGEWYHIRNYYEKFGEFLDVYSTSRCSVDHMDVSTSAKKDRAGLGTGLWRLIPADDPAKGGIATTRASGDTVANGDTFYLQNFYGAQGYLDRVGSVTVVPIQTSRISMYPLLLSGTVPHNQQPSGELLYRPVAHFPKGRKQISRVNSTALTLIRAAPRGLWARLRINMTFPPGTPQLARKNRPRGPLIPMTTKLLWAL